MDSNCITLFKNLEIELKTINKLLENFKKLPVQMHPTIYTNLVSNGIRFRNHLLYALRECDKNYEETKNNKIFVNDKTIKFFVDERDRLEHEGYPKFDTVMSIKQLSMPQDLLKYGPKPSNANGIFIDGLGVGWKIKQSNNEISKLYVNIPEEQVKQKIIPNKLPEELSNKSMEELLTYLVEYLNKIFKETKEETE